MINLLLVFIVKVSAMGAPPPVQKFNADDYCFLVEKIDQESTDMILDCLKTTGKKKLYLHSPGGIVPFGQMILAYVKENNITVFCDSCYSMAANIWLNAPKREMHADSKFMMHYIWCYWIGPATIKDLRIQADKMERDTEAFLKDLTEYQRSYFIFKMKQSDFYFNKKTIDHLGLNYKLMVK